MRPFDIPAIRETYASFPPAQQAHLKRLRELIYEAADSLGLALTPGQAPLNSALDSLCA